MSSSEAAPRQLQRDASQPLHQQLATVLREQIENGALSEGTRLPPERALCETYSVSRITVRHAISQLEQENLVSRMQGLGTFVNAKKYNQPLAEIHSFEQAMRTFGYEAGTTIHRIDTLPGDLLFSSALQTNPNESITRLQLIGLGSGAPIVFYDSRFSQVVGDRIIATAQEWAAQQRSFSTLDLYEDVPEFRPASAEQVFEATVSDPELSEILQIPLGSPILQVTSVISSPHGPIEYRRASYRGDKYRFVIQRDLMAERLP